MQSFRLTLYAGVYRQLGGGNEAVEPEPLPSSDGVALAPILVEARPESETGDAQPAGLAEITVPEEVVAPVETPVEVNLPHA